MRFPAHRSRLSRLALVLVLVLSARGWPQSGVDGSLTGTMGSVTVDGQQFYRMSMRPDIPLGNWGLCLDLELFIGADGDLSSHGWEFDTRTEALDSFLRKIYYLRYGRPGDPVYARIGTLDDVTLGYGLIMAGYRNTLQYPGTKKTGLVFQVEDLAGSGLGVEGMVNNFQDLQEGGAVVGLRVSKRVRGKLTMGLTYVVDLDQYSGLVDSDDDGYPDAVDAFPDNARLALDNDGDGLPDKADNDDDNDGIIDVDAGSGLADEVVAGLISLNTTHGDELFPVDRSVSRRRPFNRDQVDADRFGILGFDAAYPLASGPQYSFKLYGQVAVLMDDADALTADQAREQGVAPGNGKAKGWGLSAPGVWGQAGPLHGQLEFRYFRDDFDAGYFDNLYELDRARVDAATGHARSKDAQLTRSETLTGVYGDLATDLGGLIRASAAYQYLTGGDDPKQQLRAEASAATALLRRVPRLTSARAYYQKNNIGARLNRHGTGDDDFFESTEDTFYGYTLGLNMAGDVSVVWETRYLFDRSAAGKLTRRKILTIETVFGF